MEGILQSVGRSGTPLADASLWHLVVAGNEELSAACGRITFAGPELRSLVYRPGQDLMLRIPTGEGKVTHRRYTIRRADRHLGTVEIDIVLHGDGPGARWAAAAEAGAALDAIGPRGSIGIVDAADWHLFIGDETALPGMLAMAEVLAPHVAATVVAELPHATRGHWPDLAEGSDVDLRWIERGDAPPGQADWLLGTASSLRWPGRGRGHAYVAGEMQVVRAIADLLEERGLGRDQVSSKAYWRRDRANAAHGEPLSP